MRERQNKEGDEVGKDGGANKPDPSGKSRVTRDVFRAHEKIP